MKRNVLEYLEDILPEYSGKTAIIDGERTLTFGEIETYAKRLGCMITSIINDCRKPVAVYLPKSADCIVAFIGILYSGNIYVPLDIMSPASRLQYIFDNLQDPFFITSDKCIESLISMGVIQDKIISIDDIYLGLNNGENDIIHIPEKLIDTDPLYIMYTSGSTGIPKGVVIPHRGVIDYIDWAIDCFKVSDKETIGNQAPFYFDNSTLDIYLCLATGAQLVIIPEQYFSFPVKLMEYVTQQNINFIFWVPSLMMYVANTKALDHLEVPGLRKVLFAGEVMPNRHLNYWRTKFPNTLFANLYGPTEITVDCTYYIVNKSFSDDDKLPIGFPCRNTDVIILNDNNSPAQVNEQGELCVRGSSLALGYWNNPVKSAEVFAQNPLNDNYFDRIYRTGDYVYVNEDNEIMFMGRKDYQIKHMGYRIELGEIETAVTNMDGVHNACVLYNKNKQEITMFYEGEEPLTKASIRKHLAAKLPKYMLPTKIIKMANLPLNKNSKIDRTLLMLELDDQTSKA